MNKPFIAAADRNKDAILRVLQPLVLNGKELLEIGAGTGQHATHCCKKLPHLLWQPTELEINISGLQQWVSESKASNLCAPFVLDVQYYDWRADAYDFVFTSNTVHFMSWPNIVSMFCGVSLTLKPSGLFFVYGPFYCEGSLVSEGNKKLAAWLQEQSSDFYIRGISEINNLANDYNFRLVNNYNMPSNNHLLVFRQG